MPYLATFADPNRQQSVKPSLAPTLARIGEIRLCNTIQLSHKGILFLPLLTNKSYANQDTFFMSFCKRHLLLIDLFTENICVYDAVWSIPCTKITSFSNHKFPFD